MSNKVNDMLATLSPKSKEPNSAATLTKWIAAVESQSGQPGGRIAWLVASTIVIAKLQQVVDADGTPKFLLKGGSLLQHRLGISSRSTKDIDGLVREDIDEFIEKLDVALREPWGPIGFSRSAVEEVAVPGKSVKPRRIYVVLSLRGKQWRRIKVEISPDEGRAGSAIEEFPSPSLQGFGIPTPNSLFGLALCYQVAQKYHGATDPHNPPERVNDRARDVLDLVLIKRLADETGSPSKEEIATAIRDIFDVRAREAETAGLASRHLPAKITPYPHWETDFKAAALDAGVDISLDDATRTANAWIESILEQ